MSAKILDGKRTAKDIIANIGKEINMQKINAKIAVILAGHDPASETYVQMKEKRCKEAGIDCKIIRFGENVPEQEIKEKIFEFNAAEDVTGILVQFPLPKKIDGNKIVNAINPEKDVDGLTDENRKKLAEGDESLACAAPKGILRLLEEYNLSLKNKKIVVVGYGYLVGQPLSIMLKNRNADFTVCDDTTENLKEETKKADILISATGAPKLIKSDNIKEKAIVIDAGTAKVNDMLVGDVEFDSVKEKASWITPVPGGVGPMTIAMLIENVLNAALRKK